MLLSTRQLNRPCRGHHFRRLQALKGLEARGFTGVIDIHVTTILNPTLYSLQLRDRLGLLPDQAQLHGGELRRVRTRHTNSFPRRCYHLSAGVRPTGGCSVPLLPHPAVRRAAGDRPRQTVPGGPRRRRNGADGPGLAGHRCSAPLGGVDRLRAAVCHTRAVEAVYGWGTKLSSFQGLRGAPVPGAPFGFSGVRRRRRSPSR